MKSFLSFLLLAGLLMGCKETPTLENFSLTEWKKDRLGCKGNRIKQFSSLQKQLAKLKGLGQNQILSLLGKPDFHELYERNQRFYIYFYDKGAQCQKGRLEQVNIHSGKILKIRFSALDAVTETVVVE